ncbi:MAG: macro domain-containing protein [Clostridia bacterium]|nr:macro domain-containing protein [Clostridia bacterium]
MKLAGLIIGYLAKLNNEPIKQCQTDEQYFEEYQRLIKKSDLNKLNAAFFKSEDAYLKDIVESRGVTDITSFSYRLSSVNTSPTSLSAELLINPVIDTEDDIYTFGGSALKKACTNLSEDTVTGGFALQYGSIYNMVAPKISQKLTSDNIAAIRALYNKAADYAADNCVKSVVFMPIKVANPLLYKQVQKIAIDTLLFRKDLNFIKKVFVTGEDK